MKRLYWEQVNESAQVHIIQNDGTMILPAFVNLDIDHSEQWETVVFTEVADAARIVDRVAAALDVDRVYRGLGVRVYYAVIVSEKPDPHAEFLRSEILDRR